MPQQDELVKLNRLLVDPKELGEYLIAAHELARRVLEGTYPAKEMAELMRAQCKQPKVDPQLYAARQAAEHCGLETALLCFTHLALVTQDAADALKAYEMANRMLECKCYSEVERAAIYDCIALIHYKLFPAFSEQHSLKLLPLDQLLHHNPVWHAHHKTLANNLWRKVFDHDQPNCSDINTWQAECDEALKLEPNPLFDEYFLMLIAAAMLFRPAEKKTATIIALCDKILGYYARAKAMCLLKRFDELREKLEQDLASIVIPGNQYEPCDLGAILDKLLAASELVKHTREPRDLSMAYPAISNLLDEIPRRTSQFHNLPNVGVFNANFWQNIADGVNPGKTLAETRCAFLEKTCKRSGNMANVDAQMLVLFHPDSWLNIYLPPHFGFNDPTLDPDHPVFDPERHNYSVEQKIAAYLVMAEDWPGDVFKRDHLERAYNHALALDDSYYKVLTLCDIYEVKVRFGLDKKNKRA